LGERIRVDAAAAVASVMRAVVLVTVVLVMGHG
jgi:hypothetical protein